MNIDLILTLLAGIPVVLSVVFFAVVLWIDCRNRKDPGSGVK